MTLSAVHTLAMAGHECLYQAGELEMFAHTLERVGRHLIIHSNLGECTHVCTGGLMEDLNVLKRMMELVGDIEEQLLAVTAVMKRLPETED